MRLVMVLMEPPLPFFGAMSREYYALYKTLVARGHDVTAFAVCNSEEQRKAALELFPPGAYDLRLYPHAPDGSPRSKLATLLRPYSYPFSPALERGLERALSSPFDVLHLSQTFAGWLGLSRTHKSLLSVLSLAAVDTDPSCRPREELRRRMMLRAERRLIRAYPELRTLSPRLASAVSRLNPTARVHTVPLAFDITHYQSVERPNGANPVVGLFGSMTWPPTRRAAERFLSRLWPEIRRQAPYAEALIAGIGAREQLERFLEMPGVRIVEDVPDMRPYFERTTVLLYPATRATGIKVKVLEALAYGVPTVTTAEGAEGIPIEDGAHALLAESDEALVEHTLCLLRSTDRRDALRARGRALLRDEYRLDSTVEKLEGVYRAIGARRG